MASFQYNDSEREVRVFVSSPFHDMHQERDVLNTHIFTQLSRLCEERGLLWVPVDLRWGIPEEQSDAGQVIPICFDQIERCRPFFIGILGERYGALAGSFNPELIEREPWLKGTAGTSITELEMMFAALNDPEKAQQAFFYFRDPAYIDNLPQDQKSHYREGNLESVRRLTALKDKIRRTFPERVREKYSDPQTLGQMVYQDLKAAIEKVYPYRVVARRLGEEQSDEKYVSRHNGFYIKRDGLDRQLDAFMEATGPPLLLVGDSGSGKSSLMVNWSLYYQEAHPEITVIRQQVISDFRENQALVTSQCIMEQLCQRFRLQTWIPRHPDEIIPAFVRCLNQCAEQGRVLLLIDSIGGLGDAAGWTGLEWVVSRISPQVKLILSVQTKHQNLEERGFQILEIGDLQPGERRDFIRHFLQERYAKMLNSHQIERIAGAQYSGNPLYLKALLEELSLHGSIETLDAIIDRYLEKADVVELFEDILCRYERDYGQSRVRTALCALWAARRGLAESELLQLMEENGKPLPYALWAPLFAAMVRFLVNQQGYLSFAYDGFRQAVKQRYLPSDQKRKVHERLASFFAGTGQLNRQVEELPWQLVHSRAWESLGYRMADDQFIKTYYALDAEEALEIWRLLEQHSLAAARHYAPVIDAPEEHLDCAQSVCHLLSELGYLEEAARLASSLLDHYSRQPSKPQQVANLKKNYAAILTGLGQHQAAAAILDELTPYNPRKMAEIEGLKGRNARNSGRWTEAMEHFQLQESLCNQAHDYKGINRSRTDQARVLEQWQRWDEAADLYEEVHRNCQLRGDKLGLSFCLSGESRVAQQRGDYHLATEKLQEQEELLREMGNRKGELSFCLGDQGALFLKQGRLKEAMARLEAQELLCREIKDRAGQISSLQKQKKLVGHLSDWNRQQRITERLIKLMPEPKPRDKEESSPLSHIARQLIMRGDLDRAMRLYDLETKICRSEGGHRKRLATALGGMAEILLDKGEVEPAALLLSEQGELFQQLDDKRGINFNLRQRARVMEARGDVDAALHLLKEEESLCREIGYLKGLSLSLGEQARIHQGQGEIELAQGMVQQEAQLCREIKDWQGEIRALNKLVALLPPEEAGPCQERVEALNSIRGDAPILHPLEPEKIDAQIKSLRERREFSVALALLVEQGSLYQQAGPLSKYCDSLSQQAQVLIAMKRWAEALDKLEQCESIHRQSAKQRPLAYCLGQKGQVLNRLQEFAKARAVFLEQEALCLSLYDDRGRAFALGGLGIACQGLKELTAACEAFQAQECLLQLGDQKQLAACLDHQAQVAQAQQDWPGLNELMLRQETIWRQLGVHKKLAECLTRRGRTLIKLDQYDQAWQLAREAEALCRRHAMKFYLAFALSIRDEVHERRGEYDEAIELVREEARIHRELDNKPGIMHCMGREARLLKDQGEAYRAVKLLAEPEGYYREQGDVKRLLFILGLKVQSCRQMGDIPQAMQAVDEQIVLYGRSGMQKRLGDCLGARANLLRIQGRLEEALACLLDQEELVLSLQDKAALYTCLGYQALINRLLGCSEQALICLNRQEELSHLMGEPEMLARNLEQQGRILLESGDYAGALRLYAQQESIYRGVGQQERLVYCLGSQALLHFKAGQLREAMEYYQRQESLSREIELTDSLLFALDGQVRVYMMRQEYTLALVRLREAEALLREREQIERLMECLRLQAAAKSELQNYQEAMKLFSEVEKLYRDIGNIRGLVLVLGGEADTYRKQGQLQSALQIYQQQEELARDNGFFRELMFSLSNQGKVFREGGDYQAALRAFEEQEQLARQHENNSALAYALGQQVTTLVEQGEMEAARIILEKEEEHCRQSGDQRALAFALGLKADFYKMKEEPEAFLQTLKEQQTLLRQLGERVLLADCLQPMAEFYRQRGENGPLLEVLSEIGELYAQIQDKPKQQYTLAKMVRLHLAGADYAAALNALAKQEAICHELDDRVALYVCLSRRYDIFKMIRDYRSAQRIVAQREELCQGLGGRGGMPVCLQKQADELREANDLDGALELLEEAELICREAMDEAALAACLDKEARLLVRMEELERASEALHERAEILARLQEPKAVASCLEQMAGVLNEQGKLEEAKTLQLQAGEMLREARRSQPQERLLDDIAGMRPGLVLANQHYWPEGWTEPEEWSVSDTQANLQRLQMALKNGLVLEAIASKCDEKATLFTRLGDIEGCIESQEVTVQVGRDGKPPAKAAASRRYKPVQFKVLAVENNGERPKAILSRRQVQQEVKNWMITQITPGMPLAGIITSLQPYGAFVDIGAGVTAIMMVEDISVARMKHPNERFTIGQRIVVVVKEFNPEREQWQVSHKELLGTWEENVRNYREGMTVSGIIKDPDSNGNFFVEITPNLEGLVDPRAGLEYGQRIMVLIKKITPDTRRIKLEIVQD